MSNILNNGAEDLSGEVNALWECIVRAESGAQEQQCIYSNIVCISVYAKVSSSQGREWSCADSQFCLLCSLFFSPLLKEAKNGKG